jgi:iron complex outermembrane receptor protein
MIKLSKVSGAVALGLGITWTVPSALAQSAPAEQQLEKIEVTGSSIRRTDAETPSPVQVITAEDLKKSGYTTISEVLRNISANNQGTLTQGFSGAFAAGASGVALRGLTVGATLVLIDGHRSAPYPLSDDGQRSFVDISAIPFDTIERVEILKDGASAIYGSDAIAGVVNVILKKSYVGTRINAEAGQTGHDDGKTKHFSIIHGVGDLDADGQTGYLSLEYRHQDPIYLVNRPGIMTLRDYTPFGGVNATPGVANAANQGYPASITGYTVGPTGLITSQLGCKATNAFGPNCPYGINNSLEIEPGTRNVNLLGKYTKALPDNWKLGVTASLFSSGAEQINNLPGTAAISGLSSISAGPSQAIPTAYPAAGPLFVTVPATGDTLQTTFTGIGPNRTQVDSSTYRLITDLNGTEWGWDLGATAGFNKAILHNKVNGAISIPGLSSLLSSLPASTTAAQLNAVLQNSGNAGILAPQLTSTDSSEVDYLQVRGSREIAKLPAGSLDLALGGEYTHHALNSVAPGQTAAGETYQGNDAFAIGTQNIASAYAELDAQLLKNLEGNFALRYDHVDTYGSSTTPKFGIKYTPIEQLTLRGTYSQGFRAPNPAESGTAGQAFYYAQINDPVLCPGGGKLSTDIKSQCSLVPAFYQESNPKLQPEKSHSYTLGLVFEPVRGYNMAVDYYQIKLDNQVTSAINAAPISTLTPNAVRGPAGQSYQTIGGQTITPSVGQILFIPTPYVNANTVKTTGMDIDLQARWDLKAFGVFSTDLNLTRVFKYELVSPLVGTVELAGTHGPSGISGDTGTPQNRAVWTFSWDRGPLNIASTINYISAYSVIDPASGLPDCQTAIFSNYNGSFAYGVPSATANTCNVSSFTTVDFSTHYKYDKNFTFYGAILNAFDRPPPMDLETYGGSNYNPSLHGQGAIGRFFSVGLTYDF